eukprot:2242851-Rhodomonas_salina.2
MDQIKQTCIPSGVVYRFYADDGKEFNVADGTTLWRDLCTKGTLEYNTKNFRTFTGAYNHGVWLKPATLAKDTFDDGVYVHPGRQQSESTHPNCKLKDLDGYAKGGIWLEDAIKSLQKQFGPNLVIHGLHCLV